MKNTELYIADTLVDLDSESLITMNYMLEETDNPTIVKNSFSKSISLPATEANNALFGHIYNLSRETLLVANRNNGVYFNTLKRTPFAFYNEGELVESGYVQLTGIAVTNGEARYTVQAYGGLGDFLYNLMYTEDGEKRNLASLDFGIEGHDGEHTTEMDFTIDRNVVNRAWSTLPRAGRNSIEEVVQFIPAYNGVSSDFDAKHAVINYSGISSMGLPRTLTDNGKTYKDINGYGGLEFTRSMDEAEVRDMRSYLQRPALSVEALFNACANPANNGGYIVNLDPAFFSVDNPLYFDAYITLPMLGVETENTDSSFELSGRDGYIGGTSNTFVRDIGVGTRSISNVVNNANIKVIVPLSIAIDSTLSELYTDVDLYKQVEKELGGGMVEMSHEYDKTYYSAIVAQVVVTDLKGGNVLAVSNEVAFSNKGAFNRGWGVYRKYDDVDRGVENIKGHFKQRDRLCQFVSEFETNTFPISVSFIKGNVESIVVTLRVQRVYKSNYTDISTNASLLWKSDTFYEDTMLENYSIDDIKTVDNVIGCYRDGSTVEVSTAHLPSISSGSKVTKDILLGSTESPADYLLSYIKLFNLRFIKDVGAKTITITPNYFNGNIIDIEDRIDRAQAVNITPNVFSKKFMRLGLSQPETYFAKKYKAMNKLDYGQKRVDTGFTFNNETEEVYKDNLYTSAVPCLATSKFFNTFRNASGVEVFAPIADNPKLILAEGNATTGYNTLTKDIVSPQYIDAKMSVPFSAYKGYDLMPRMCYFDEKEGVREAVDVSNNLVVFCKNVELKNSNGEAVSYWLTDDVPEMITLCGANCYLLTNEVHDTIGNDIAIQLTNLPLFLSMRLMDTHVRESFDFAKSKESYIPGINYPEGVTLYERYWSALYNDRMNVDTRKVTCMVDLSGIAVNSELLRNIFYFDNNYWLLNSIEDYDIATNKLTKCEFIKVKSLDAYIKRNLELN